MKRIGEGTLTYSRSLTGQGPVAGFNVALNVFDGLSRVNHKHQEWTTRDGHLLGALCDITVRAGAGEDFTTNFYGLGNTWIVRNAFRKFHFLRNEMFDKAGIEKSERGKYGHTLRPNLLPDSKWEGTVNADFNQTFPGASLAGGDTWATGSVSSFVIKDGQDGSGGAPIRNDMQETLDFTQLVSAVNASKVTGVAQDLDLYDEWDIHIILEHIVEATSGEADKWTSVSMLKAYLEDRNAEIPDATTNSAIVGWNPLAALASQTSTSGEIADIAAEQTLEAPPYDIGTEVYDSGVQLCHKGFMTLESNYDTYSGPNERKLTNVFLPSGWLTFNSKSDDFEMDIDVKGIFECREVA
ncbi:MAG: hypothetical protein [Circular genetic element sp.]|nr:MAG: hypothetical protein [Circular genetic element sp.]